MFSLPNVSPEEQKNVIDGIAKKIVGWEMDPIAIVFFSMVKPFSLLTTHLGLLPVAPFLEAFGIPAFKFVSIFEDQNNVEKLIVSIENQRDERENEKRKKKAGKVTIFDKLKKKIIGR